MKIALDGGGLCAPVNKRFGNYVFSYNLIQSLLKFDKKNRYSIYSLCKKPADLKLSGTANYRILLPRRLWMKLTVSVEELVRGSDVYLGLNQAIPLYTQARILAFSHGLSFYYYPQYYRDEYFRFTLQLGEMLKRADRIIVSSEKVKKEFKELFPKRKNICVIHFAVPNDIISMTSISRSWDTRRGKYFLYVGMDHPVKNIGFLQKIMKDFPGYKLYQAHSVSRKELKRLYSQASLLLTASRYESFNLPVLEALACNTPVVGLEPAIIPELAPYVNVTRDKMEFVEKVKKVIKGEGIMPERNKIIERFSWKRYVSELIKLYNE